MIHINLTMEHSFGYIKSIVISPFKYKFAKQIIDFSVFIFFPVNTHPWAYRDMSRLLWD